MPDLIRHPVPSWIPAFAGMTILRYLIAGVIRRSVVSVPSLDPLNPWTLFSNYIGEEPNKYCPELIDG